MESTMLSDEAILRGFNPSLTPLKKHLYLSAYYVHKKTGVALQARNFGLTDQFFHPSWRRVDFQRVINFHQIRFGKGAFANMQGAAIALLK